MSAAVVALSALAGVPAGAFVNLVVDRVPDKVPLRGPRDGEVCPPVAFAGIPAQPWLMRRGKGPGGQDLPRRWLWVELVTVALFAAMAIRHGDHLTVVPLLLLAGALVAVSVIDLQLLRIPDRVTFPTLAVAVPLVLLVSARYEIDAFRGAVVGSALYFVVLLIPHLVYPRGMGFGDVKLALVMGLFLGWMGWTPIHPIAGPVQFVLYGLMLGCILGVLFGVISQVVTRRRGEFPFGPALALACLVVVYFAADLRT